MLDRWQSAITCRIAIASFKDIQVQCDLLSKISSIIRYSVLHARKGEKVVMWFTESLCTGLKYSGKNFNHPSNIQPHKHLQY